MPTSNKYKIEIKGKKNEKTYKIFSVLGPISRILTVAFILPTVLVSLYFLFGVGFSLILSILFDVIANQNVYTIEYCWDEGFFFVKKIKLDGKEIILEKMDCREIEDIEMVEEIDDLNANYTNENDKMGYITKITYGEKTFYVTLDEYMFALVSNGRKQ